MSSFNQASSGSSSRAGRSKPSSISRTHFGNAALSLAQLYRSAVNVEEESALRMIDRVRQFCTMAAGPDNATTNVKTVNLQQLLRFLEVQENSVVTAAQRGVEPRMNQQQQQQHQPSGNGFDSSHHHHHHHHQNNNTNNDQQHHKMSRQDRPRFKRELWQTDIDTAILAARDLEEALGQVVTNGMSSSVMSMTTRRSPPNSAGATPQSRIFPSQHTNQQHQQSSSFSHAPPHGFNNQLQQSTSNNNNNDDDDDFCVDDDENNNVGDEMNRCGGQHQQQQQHQFDNNHHSSSPPEFAYQQMQFTQGSRWVRRRVEEDF